MYLFSQKRKRLSSDMFGDKFMMQLQVWGFFWIYTNRWLWSWEIQGSLYHIARFFPVETCLEREIKRESDQSHFKLSVSWTQQKISLQPFLSAQRKPIAAISREAISWAIQILVRTSSHIWVVNLFIMVWQRNPIAVGITSSNLLWTTHSFDDKKLPTVKKHLV